MEKSRALTARANPYRGKQPRDFVRLREMGIKTVLDLRGGAVHAPKERKQVEATGME
jgi:hypothetical protein